ncbi:MAG: hypothetical protein WBO30_10225 [Ferruginibacter sp.]
MAGFDQSACFSRHVNRNGKADGMPGSNFGKRPVITEMPYSSNQAAQKATDKKEIDKLKKYLIQH